MLDNSHVIDNPGALALMKIVGGAVSFPLLVALALLLTALLVCVGNDTRT